MKPNARSIARDVDVAAVRRLLRTFPVTALTGARQCGKTTPARLFKADHCFD